MLQLQLVTIIMMLNWKGQQILPLTLSSWTKKGKREHPLTHQIIHHHHHKRPPPLPLLILILLSDLQRRIIQKREATRSYQIESESRHQKRMRSRLQRKLQEKEKNAGVRNAQIMPYKQGCASTWGKVKSSDATVDSGRTYYILITYHCRQCKVGWPKCSLTERGGVCWGHKAQVKVK